MIEAHIADGDFVLIRPQTTARNGDIVVAQVEENAVTLKRFFKEKDQIRLQPANPAYPPQFYDDVRIQGKLIGVDTIQRRGSCIGRRLDPTPRSEGPRFMTPVFLARLADSRRSTRCFAQRLMPPVVRGVDIHRVVHISLTAR